MERDRGEMKTTVTLFILRLLAAIALLLLPARHALAESPDDILIVVNLSSKVTEAELGELRAIFLKKRTRWKSGDKVVPVHAKAGTELREAFRTRLLEMASYDEKSYWQEQQIRHGLDPPASFKIPLKAVFKLRDAVGYCFRHEFRESVAKILLVIPADR